MAIRILWAVFVMAAAIFGGDKASAADVKLDNYMAACTTDPDLVEEFKGDPKVTPQVFCECVSGKLKETDATQADIDMLVKMHKDAITDADVEGFPTLEDLMIANEDYEDSCRQRLGIVVETDEDVMPEDAEGMMPEDEVPPPAEDETPPDARD